MDIFKLSVMIALIILLLILLVVEFAAGNLRPSVTPLSSPLPTQAQPRPTATPPAIPSQTLPVVVEPPIDNRLTLTGASLPAGTLTLVGSGVPDAEIELVDNGQVVGEIRVGADGQWRFTYVPAGGEHEVFARIRGEPGTASSVFKVTVMAPMPSLPMGERCIGPVGRIEGNIYVVGVCDTLTQISRITGLSVKALIAANPQITDTNRIYVGQPVWLPR